MKLRVPERPKITHWDHNGHYHGYLLQQLPASGLRRALDVGCGKGDFARLLAERAELVEAIDVSPRMITTAQAAPTNPPNIRWILGDVLTAGLDLGRYDVVTAIASLHHLPLEAGLRRLADLVRPGGALAILGLARASTLSDYALAALAMAIDPAIGMGKNIGGRSNRPHELPSAAMPTRNPQITIREIRAVASQLLPGFRLRRHLFFRYSLLWRKPTPEGRRAVVEASDSRPKGTYP